VDTLSRPGLISRVVVTLLGAVLLLAGTVAGSDDDFPFGPMRMFAGVNGPNEDAPDPRVDGVDATGATVSLGPEATGVRRAEIEARLDRYTADPTLLKEIADAYRRRNPDAPPIVEMRLIIRWHQVRGSALTGVRREETVAVWKAP
jgi:hypothetical protein